MLLLVIFLWACFTWHPWVALALILHYIWTQS